MKAFLAVLFTIPLLAQDLPFMEKFADPDTREASLSNLTPRTRDWFYYHALHQQLSGDAVAFKATMQEWKKITEAPESPVSSQGFSILENRQLLLDSKTNPDAAAATLINRLELDFDFEKSSVVEAREDPSILDPQFITDAAFQTEIEKQSPDEPWSHFSHERIQEELRNVKDFSNEKRDALLALIKNATTTETLELIALCLEKSENHKFGDAPVHHTLVHSQLTTLLKRIPKLALNQVFSERYLQTLRPSDESNYLNNPAIYLAHLQSCDDYLRDLPPVFDSWKADCLWQKLLLQQRSGKLVREDLMRYIALPISACPLIDLTKKPQRASVPFAQSHFDVIGGNLTGTIENLEAMLMHFLREADEPGDFTSYIPEQTLRKLHAKSHLLTGDESNKWTTPFSADELQELRKKTQLNFAADQPARFSSQDEVALLLDCKNTPTVTIRIFEIDLLRFLRKNQSEPDASIELDGLVPHIERTLTYNQAPIVQHREKIIIPELKGRGVWVVECVSEGIASRALIRKGDLIPFVEKTHEGQLIRLYDETQQPIRNFRLHSSRETMNSKKDGSLLIPYSHDLSLPQNTVIEEIAQNANSPTLAKILDIASTTVDYKLTCSFHVDREQLIADQTARLHLQPRLFNHDQTTSLDIIKNASIIVTAQLISGATSDHVITPKTLESSMTAEFPMPRDATHINIILRGEIPRPAQQSTIKLRAEHSYLINQSLNTNEIYSGFFVRTSQGHRLEIFGRNGEPAAALSIPIEFKHRKYNLPLTFNLQSSDAGVIELGELIDIASVKLDTSYIISQPYHPQALEKTSLPLVIHRSSADTIRIPVPKNVPRNSINLIETTTVTTPNQPDKHLATRDHHQLINYEGDLLLISKIPAGNYQLTLNDTSIPIRISPAPLTSGHLVSAQRILQATAESALTISRTEVDEANIKIHLKDHSKNTRVSVVASQFSPQHLLSDAHDQFPKIIPAYKMLGHEQSSFLTNRLLGDEVRYVLDRRTNKIYPGNMLPRPGLLVHRTELNSDEGNYDPAHLPQPGELRKKSQLDRSRESSITQKPLGTSSSEACFDFLARGSSVFYNLKPDANGVVTIARKNLSHARFLTICAAEDQHYQQSTIALDPTPLKLRPRQLQRALDPEKHYIGTQRAVILQKGQSESINNLLDARWKDYTTIEDVFQTFIGSPKSMLVTFSFLPNWDTLKEERKITLYQLHACHELNLFLARKDRPFFDKVVKPSLLQKREVDFIDHYLLDHDLSGYLNQREWSKLNAAERALLCRALPAEAKRIRQEMQFEQWQTPTPLAQQAMNFRTALEGSELSLKDRADLAALGLRSQHERQFLAAQIQEDVSSIIIPSIDYQDLSLNECIADLRRYYPNIHLHTPIATTQQDETRGLDAVAGGLGALTNPGELRVRELKLTQVSLPTVLKYLCESTRMKYEVGHDSITIRPASDDGEDIITRTIQVPPDFLDALTENPGSDDAADPFASVGESGGGLRPRSNIQDLLRSKGVAFPEKASANYIAATGQLVVNNTPSNLDLIEQITMALKGGSGRSLKRKEAKGLVDSPAASNDPFASADESSPPIHSPFQHEEEESDEPTTSPAQRSSDHHLKTLVYQESSYWKVNRDADYDPARLIKINQFWLDLALWDGKGNFLSTNFMECKNSDNEMLMALALLDLPFRSTPSETTRQGESLNLTAKQPLILFYRDTRIADKVMENSPILVSQTFYPADDRFRSENGREIENTIVGGKFSTGTPYGSAVILANPTGETRQVQVLWQIPAGSIPLEGKAMTESEMIELAPYGSHQINFSFYFPQKGNFLCYPFHVSENDAVLAYPKVTSMQVSDALHETEADYFYHLADDGDETKLLEFLRTKSLFDENTALHWLCWRLKNRAFYDQVIKILNDRLFFDADVFAFAFFHRDYENIRRYLENSTTVNAVGPWLDSPFLHVTATRDLNWFNREFDPFINNRAYRMSNQNQLPLEMAKYHYANFLDILCHKTELSGDDFLQICYFYLLQNRTEEALLTFQKIDRAKLAQQLHYDYLHCYMLFFEGKSADAKNIAQSYQNQPQGIWRQRFQSVVSQADEIAEAEEVEGKPENKGTTGRYLNMAYKDDDKLWLTHQGRKEAQIQLYQVDMELLFTANPFLENNKVLHHAIRPNKTLAVALKGKETSVDLPADYSQGNVIAAIEDGTTQVVQSINSSKLAMIVNKELGEIQVLERASNKRQAQTYVKIYARMNDGSVEFFKDGYTDLRGKCNYRDHNNIHPSSVKDFAIFLHHPKLGTRVEQVLGN